MAERIVLLFIITADHQLWSDKEFVPLRDVVHGGWRYVTGRVFCRGDLGAFHTGVSGADFNLQTVG